MAIKAPSRPILLAVIAASLLAFGQAAVESSESSTKGQDIAIRSQTATDDAMSNALKANKLQFNRLVDLYQTDKRRVWRRTDGSLIPFETAEYKDLLKKVGLEGLTGDSALWMPRPYDADIVERAKGLNAFTAYQYHGIFFRTPTTIFWSWEPQFRQTVWKDYFYAPVEPLIKDGDIWWPRSHHHGDLYRSSKLVASLDQYPAHWLNATPGKRIAECVYRQLEIRWYLRLCKS